MSKILSCSIDLNKIDKTKVVHGQNGAQYYNFSVVINDESNEYGKDVSITEGQSQEERLNKVKRKFIGNGKTVYNG